MGIAQASVTVDRQPRDAEKPEHVQPEDDDDASPDLGDEPLHGDEQRSEEPRRDSQRDEDGREPRAKGERMEEEAGALVERRRALELLDRASGQKREVRGNQRQDARGDEGDEPS